MQHVTQTETKIHTPKAVPKVNSVELQHKKTSLCYWRRCIDIWNLILNNTFELGKANVRIKLSTSISRFVDFTTKRFRILKENYINLESYIIITLNDVGFGLNQTIICKYEGLVYVRITYKKISWSLETDGSEQQVLPVVLQQILPSSQFTLDIMLLYWKMILLLYQSYVMSLYVFVRK